jgi:serine/threonine protein kinase
LLRWRELRQLGQQPSAEELCADCPELADELRDRIQAVESMERRLDPQTNHVHTPLLAGNGADGPRTLPATEAATVPVDPLLVAGYEILDVLGQGGMGVVYKARQLRLKRLVALKMILSGPHASKAQLARFRAEAEAIARLQHPNIVQVYEVGESDGRPYFSMEFIEGGSLAQELGGTPMPPREAAQLVAILAEAIQAAHQRGVIHRDLKPANVLVARAGDSQPGTSPEARATVKITDFGLAKRLDVEPGQSASGCKTQTGVILGTPSYMAPEQAQGKVREMSPAVDVYALGAILYEMLTGRPPFQGASSLDTLLQVISEEPVPMSRLQPKVPRDLEAICLKCLEKSPRRRYASAQALADDLHHFLAGQPIQARSISMFRRAVRWTRRRVELIVLAAAMALAAVGLTVAFRSRPSPPPAPQAPPSDQLAPAARAILHKYCYECHGHDPAALQGGFDVLDYPILLTDERGLVVPGNTHDSLLIHRIEDNSMPPENEEEFPRLTSEEIETLKTWVAAGAPAFPPGTDGLPPDIAPSALAVQVKEVFRTNCYECHSFGKAEKGIKILNHDLLVTKRKVVVPGKPEESSLFQSLLSSDPKKAMPPLDYDRLSAADIDLVRRWIAEGALPFPREFRAKAVLPGGEQKPP